MAYAGEFDRPHSFIEMCASESPMNALLYLQNSVASVTDHSDETEAAAFRACMSYLLAAPASRADSATNSPGSSGPLPLPPHMVNAIEDDSSDSTDAVMASSQDFDPLTKPAALGGRGGPASRSTVMARHAVFEELLQFFPREERQPSEDLLDVAR